MGATGRASATAVCDSSCAEVECSDLVYRNSDDLPVECEAEVLARYFRVLSDPTRLRILLHLGGGERNVTEIVEALGGSQSRISNHLACLRWCKLVRTKRVGRQMMYSLADPEVLVFTGRTLDLIGPEQRAALASCDRLGPER